MHDKPTFEPGTKTYISESGRKITIVIPPFDPVQAKLNWAELERVVIDIWSKAGRADENLEIK